MTARLLLPAFCCLLLAAACSEDSAIGPAVPFDEQFTLAPGEAAVVGDGAMRVQFLRVSEDSRCPADVVCVHAGSAIVDILADGTPYELHTGDALRAAIAHDGARIELVELQPYPLSGRTIAPGDYRATLTVSR